MNGTRSSPGETPDRSLSKVLAVIGLVASLITIFSFTTGIGSVSGLFSWTQGQDRPVADAPHLTLSIRGLQVSVNECVPDASGEIEVKKGKAFQCDVVMTNKGRDPNGMTLLGFLEARDNEGNRATTSWFVENAPLVLKTGGTVTIPMQLGGWSETARSASLRITVGGTPLEFTDIPIRQ